MGTISYGQHTYGEIIRRGEGNTISVGKYTQIAENVIADGGFQHNTGFISTFPFNQKFEGLEHLTGHPNIKGNITIGNDVWIGEGAVIMSGVTVGDGAIIGMRAIITKNVPAYAIVVGAPQKILRMRYDPDRIKALLKIEWWEWNEEKVRENAHLIMSENINEFIKLHYGK